MLFFKKKQNKTPKNTENLNKTNTLKSGAKQDLNKITPKAKLLNEDLLDNRLYEFTHKIKNFTKDDANATLLARQLSRLIKAYKF